MTDSTNDYDRGADTEGGALSPGSTATGSGTSMGGSSAAEDIYNEQGTTEADVTDGADQKLPKIAGDDSEK